ncbi:type II toxin-antitoxin system VapC family toxin [Marinihelvus fidelis]|uniref:Type II toxin-antitoxin system VapC family toxin n=1 Tax=Marinihelvus fidelis TaxID=2613842 RepID=A0A5N0T7D8_9GAMM|nr:type II toxin-antitoxin system VapC family toxin [Marinihelvus fidelis]KAA9129736.1 type II toxin-antitoxin system VapC family toxin [Marinihelvus fidelis]
MIGLDTNVLARYYVEDRPDPATDRQRHAARSLMESGRELSVAVTVLLELEWVLRGYYQFKPGEISRVFGHLLSLPHIIVEGRTAVERALDGYQAGLDFADALHHAGYAGCETMATFDDRRFARRARRLNLSPPVMIPR